METRKQGELSAVGNWDPAAGGARASLGRARAANHRVVRAGGPVASAAARRMPRTSGWGAIQDALDAQRRAEGQPARNPEYIRER